MFSICFLISCSFSSAEAHFSHSTHYNNGDTGIGDKYMVLQQMEPEYTKPNELSQIQFSIQDKQGKDTSNVVVWLKFIQHLPMNEWLLILGQG